MEPPAAPPSVLAEAKDEEADTGANWRVPPRRLMVVLPTASIAAAYKMADALNTTVAGIVHMALARFLHDNDFLKHQEALRDYVTEAEVPGHLRPPEGG